MAHSDSQRLTYANLLVMLAKKMAQGDPYTALSLLLEAAKQHGAAAPDTAAKDIDAMFFAAIDGLVVQREHYRTCPECQRIKRELESGIDTRQDTDHDPDGGPIDPRKLN